MATAARWRLGRSALVCGAALSLVACGSQPSQDEDEPEGEFPLRVEEVSFPQQQSLAKDSQLRIEVTNVGNETVPNINVTVDGFSRKERNPVEPSEIDPGLADPERPIFVVDQSPVEFLRSDDDRGSLVDREVSPPAGAERRGTSYVDTYSLGDLPPDETAVFKWALSAVQPGPYRLHYEVNAGLDGLAEAVNDGGEPLSGTFSGEIDDTAPAARVDSTDGETIVTEDGRRIELGQAAGGGGGGAAGGGAGGGGAGSGGGGGGGQQYRGGGSGSGGSGG